MDEAVAALDGMLRHWRVAGQEWFSLEAIIGVASRGEQPALVDPHAMKTPTLLRVMLLTLGDQVRETFIRQLETHYAGIEVGLPADARAARLREIDAELGKLEQAEEAAIAAAEEGGLMIDRRPDVSPAVVLGLE